MLSEKLVILIISKVKAIWQEQTVNPIVIAAWQEMLGKLDYGDVRQAIRERVEAGGDRPSCAQLYADAVKVRDRRVAYEQQRRRKLEYHVSDEQHAANQSKFQEIIKALEKSLGQHMHKTDEEEKAP